MKIRLFAALLIALFSLSLLTGCDLNNQKEQANLSPAEVLSAQGAENIAAVPARAEEKEIPLSRESSPATQPTTPPATDKLTAEQAKEIALTHAGLTADQVKGLKVELDYDDGVPEYQVEFRHNGWEYDYEIHAQTGKILDWDKEFDD